jgi:AGCS family alanine or glycine:cation symporter
LKGDLIVGDLIVAMSDFLWGWPLILFLVFVAFILSLKIQFMQITKLGYILKNTFGKMFEKEIKEGEGNLKPFQATAASMAATIGVGNIAGVGMAIGIGGPGALFWMWVVSMFSMISKFFEIVLGVKYRKEDKETGIYKSGPMYYISDGLRQSWKWLANLYAFMFALTYLVYSFVQSNSLAIAVENMFNINPLVTGILTAVVASTVILGGLKALGKTAEKIVPIMTVVYILGVFIIIILNIKNVPAVLGQVISGAFSGTAAIGGFAGSTLIMALRNGFARGIFSNDGGLGLGAVLHGTAITNHPVKQAMWGIFEVFVDTIVVCTSTALAILLSGVLPSGLKGLELTTLAFTEGIPIPYVGNIIVSLSVILFAFTTILANEYYCEIGVNYFFKKNVSKVNMTVKMLYLFGIIYGSIGGLRTVWALADFFMALLILINLPVVLYLSKEAVQIVFDYFKPMEAKK